MFDVWLRENTSMGVQRAVLDNVARWEGGLAGFRGGAGESADVDDGGKGGG